MADDSPKIRYSLGDDEQERWFDLPSSKTPGEMFDLVRTEVNKIIALASQQVVPSNPQMEQAWIAARVCKPLSDMLTVVWVYTAVERETLQEQIAILKSRIEQLEALSEIGEKKVN
jgi:hypothetical protein